MLRLVEKPSERKKAHALFLRTLNAQLTNLGRQTLTFRPGTIELTLKGLGPGRMYVASNFHNDEAKFWNAFGLFDPSSPRQEIAVEINISMEGRRTAGAFGCDAAGQYYLLHNGGVGGGRTGIGQASFLAWLKPEPVETVGDDGRIRAMILVAKIESDQLAQRVESFVSSVCSFKAAQAAGEINDPAFTGVVAEWRAYLKEFAGRKAGPINTGFEYVSYHGDVVDALRSMLEHSKRPGTAVTNSRLIDLLVHRSQTLTDVFEVKTSSDRQSIYTALGQLLVHAPGGSAVRRHLVIPDGNSIPADIFAALASNAIEVSSFEITRAGEIIFSHDLYQRLGDRIL